MVHFLPFITEYTTARFKSTYKTYPRQKDLHKQKIIIKTVPNDVTNTSEENQILTKLN